MESISINNIIIKSEDGTPIYLTQLADVKIGGAVRRGVQTQGGVREVISGMVVKLYGTNSSTVIGRVEQKLAEINKMLPEGISFMAEKTLIHKPSNDVS